MRLGNTYEFLACFIDFHHLLTIILCNIFLQLITGKLVIVAHKIERIIISQIVAWLSVLNLLGAFSLSLFRSIYLWREFTYIGLFEGWSVLPCVLPVTFIVSFLAFFFLNYSAFFSPIRLVIIPVIFSELSIFVHSKAFPTDNGTTWLIGYHLTRLLWIPFNISSLHIFLSPPFPIAAATLDCTH